jgi:hypothetical protein
MLWILFGESWGERAVGVAVWSGSLLHWERELSELKDRFAPVFNRSEVRQSAGAFIDGALSGIARKTGWQLAEQAGLDRRIECNHCLVEVVGMRMRCAIRCAMR